MKKNFWHLFYRSIFIVLSFYIQISVYYILFDGTNDFFNLPISLFNLLTLIIGLKLLIKNTYAEAKLAWIIMFFIFPSVGGIFYLIYEKGNIPKKKLKRYKTIDQNHISARNEVKDENLLVKISDKAARRQASYLRNKAIGALYENTKTTYYPLGDVFLPDLLLELNKAEKFIFMEYFIIDDGKMWDSIEEVLIEKAKNNVEIRILYDDLGCILTLPSNLKEKLAKYNIKCFAFNKFLHVFNSEFNNRDHRKICVIDGKVGFTGGINIADEYINQYEKHGHWKDTAIRIKGNAVFSLTIMFLAMWESVTNIDEDYNQYKVESNYEEEGMLLPFSDSPIDNESVGETLYLSILNNATDYVYITSPYLIISREMHVAITNAAKSNVDVRLILPKIPDKKFVHFLSRSYYKSLIESGVKIYEYTPGFIHSKMFVSDDSVAVIGTINLDYRSLDLHFECGVWTYKSELVDNIKKDILNTFEISELIDIKDVSNLPWYRLMYLAILRTFAPLL